MHMKTCGFDSCSTLEQQHTSDLLYVIQPCATDVYSDKQFALKCNEFKENVYRLKTNNFETEFAPSFCFIVFDWRIKKKQRTK